MRTKKLKPGVPFIALLSYATASARGSFCPCGSGPVDHGDRLLTVFVDLGGWRPLCEACVKAHAPELGALLVKDRARSLLGPKPLVRRVLPNAVRASERTVETCAVEPYLGKIEDVTDTPAEGK
jgi:hypothetical protein